MNDGSVQITIEYHKKRANKMEEFIKGWAKEACAPFGSTECFCSRCEAEKFLKGLNDE